MIRFAAAAMLLAVGAPSVVWNASPNYTNSARETTYDIDSIVIHTTEGADSNGDGYYSECYTQAINWFKNSSSGVSAHYVIAPWGEITQMVADEDIAWHATYYNKRSIGIECAGFAGKANTWTPELLAALTDLVAWLCQQYGVAVVHPTDDANTWGGWYGNTGIIGHYQVQTSGSAAAASYSTKTDPGVYFPWSSFVAGVKAKFAPDVPANLSALGYLTGGQGAADFSWSPSAGATAYWLDIAENDADLQSMSGTFQNAYMGSATSYTWTGLTPGQSYAWRVYAYNTNAGVHGYPSGPVAIPAAGSSGGGSSSGGSGSGGGGCHAASGDPRSTAGSLALLALVAVLVLLARFRPFPRGSADLRIG